jgi:hypothetical protein
MENRLYLRKEQLKKKSKKFLFLIAFKVQVFVWNHML